MELETIIKYKEFCWSCGNTHLVNGECPKCQTWGESPKVVSYQPPEEPPAFCGEKKTNKEFNSQKMRPCCQCRKEWLCDLYTWGRGSCPHCGATGLVSLKNKVPFDFKNLKKEKIYVYNIKKDIIFLNPEVLAKPSKLPKLIPFSQTSSKPQAQ